MTDNQNKHLLVMTNHEHYRIFWSSKENEIKRYVKDILFYFHEPYPNQLQLVYQVPEAYPLLLIDWDGLVDYCQPNITTEQQLLNIITTFKNNAPSIAIWAVSAFEPNPLVKVKFQSIKSPYYGPNKWLLKTTDFLPLLTSYIK